MLTGLLFGLAPIARTSRAPLTLSLQDAGGRAAGSVDRQRLRRTLVVAEVSLAVVLLIGAGLLLKSFVLLRQTAIGFDSRGLMTASITLPDATYPTGAEVRAYYAQAVERIAALPDVQASGMINALPLSPCTGHASPVALRSTVSRKNVAGRGPASSPSAATTSRPRAFRSSEGACSINTIRKRLRAS